MTKNGDELRAHYVRDLKKFAAWSLGLIGVSLLAFSDWYYQLDLIDTAVQKVMMLFV